MREDELGRGDPGALDERMDERVGAAGAAPTDSSHAISRVDVARGAAVAEVSLRRA